jgi:hypothetical protein
MKPYIAVYTQKPESAAILLAVFATTHPDFNCADRRDDDSNLAQMMETSAKAADADTDVHLREYDEVGDAADELDLDDVGVTVIETESLTIANFLLKKLMELDDLFEMSKADGVYIFSVPDTRLVEMKEKYCTDLAEEDDYTIYQR